MHHSKAKKSKNLLGPSQTPHPLGGGHPYPNPIPCGASILAPSALHIASPPNESPGSASE